MSRFTPLFRSLAALIVFGFLRSAGASEEAFFRRYDLTDVATPKTKLLGYIGPDFQRLRISFDSVFRDPKRPNAYLIKGRTHVRKIKCAFEGEIVFERDDRVPPLHMHYGVDDEFKSQGLKQEGVLSGHYEFTEGPGKDCGVFKGEVSLSYFLDRNFKLHYDEIERETDGYKNNQYVGTWTRGDFTTPANWGEYRIPESKGLDIGAAAFAPKAKFCENGWEDFPSCAN